MYLRGTGGGSPALFLRMEKNILDGHNNLGLNLPFKI